MIDELHYDAIEQYGGHHGLLNEHLIESAINQPKSTYYFANCDLFEVAAAYAFHIVADHPFWDGNKRTGVLAARTFLQMNGVDSSALPEHATYEIMIRVADHQVDRAELARFFRAALSTEG